MQRTRRREFLLAAAALAAAPLARGQKPGEKRVLGALSPHPRAPAWQIAPYNARFKQLGWELGRTLFIERPEDPRGEAALAEMAEALVRRRVDAIWTIGPEAAVAAARATQSIPIVFWGVPYPVEQGLVESLARPGRNVTGLAFWAGVELVTKVLEIFRQIAPGVTRIAALVTPSSSGTVDGRPYKVPMIDEAAQRLGFDYRTLRVSSAEEIDAALAAAVRDGMQGIAAYGTTTTIRSRQRIADFANRHRLVCGSTQDRFAEAGCLFSYGANTEQTILQSMDYVDRVLRGANPAELPVARPERYELVVNLGTAKHLQLAIPQNVLLRADRVIQ